MMTFLWILIVIGSFGLGYGLAVYLIAKDPELHRLGADEAVIKKPKDGLILVACPPDVARRIIANPEGFEGNEARGMYQRATNKK